MQPTSDERREVAERLREQLRCMREDDSYREDVDILRCGNTAYRNIAGSVEPYGNFGKGNYVHIVERLADLIDPTCHVIPGKAVAELKDGTRLTGVLLSCGHAVFGVSAKDMPRFCCECGARITNEVGDD